MFVKKFIYGFIKYCNIVDNKKENTSDRAIYEISSRSTTRVV